MLFARKLLRTIGVVLFLVLITLPDSALVILVTGALLAWLSGSIMFATAAILFSLFLIALFCQSLYNQVLESNKTRLS